MQPLETLLHRIVWDAEFGRGVFALGYVDRLAGGEVVVPFTAVTVDTASRTFSIAGDEGVVARVPLHRVHTVYKNGTVIWHRPQRETRAP